MAENKQEVSNAVKGDIVELADLIKLANEGAIVNMENVEAVAAQYGVARDGEGDFYIE